MFAASVPARSSDQPWAVFARRDVIVRRRQYRGETMWVLKDPINLQYYYFRDEEYALFNWLDGRTSPREIQSRFAERFTPSRLTNADLHAFVHRLHSAGLIVADSHGQGAVFVERRRKRRRWAWVQGLANILSMRLRGIDPDRMLTWLHARLWWFFTPLALMCVVAFGLAAATLVAVEFEAFRRELPTAREALSPTSLFLLAVALSLVKVLHEFGHGLACKHFGGECHEMGVMFLVFTPCLYCNVSDSLLFPGKWRRIAVAAAGMYVELLLASLAVFVWWFSQPGPLHQLALSMIVVCSVSTVVFNGNPLMRYDGYFILAEWLEIPNLRARASEVVRRALLRVCLGIESPHDPRMPTGWAAAGLWTFAVASEIYRWIVTASILWFLNKFLQPYRLETVGRLLALISLVSLVVVPVWKFTRFLHLSGRWEEVKRKHLWGTIGALAGAALLLAAVPLPYRVPAVLEVQPHEAARVYVERPGTLVEILVQPGQQVAAGAALARLDDIDLELALDELHGQRDQQRARLTSLRSRRAEKAAAAQIRELEQSVAAIERQIDEKSTERGQLLLRAPCAGTVWPPESLPLATTAEHQLGGWHGTPLEARNLGGWMPAGTWFCSIGPANRLRAELIVDQTEVEWVRPGQTADLRFAASPLEIVHGQVTEISQRELAIAPRQLSTKSGGELPSTTDASGRERPANASYQVCVPIESASTALRPGCSGRGRIHVGYRTVAGRLWSWARHTFHFRL